MKKETLKNKARKLFSPQGLKLGNYHYDVERYESDYWGVEVYLTRHLEECTNCPLLDKQCYGDIPPYPNDEYPCHTMPPIAPYMDSGYTFKKGPDEIDEYNEFTDVEREALRMIWEEPKVLKRLTIG